MIDILFGENVVFKYFTFKWYTSFIDGTVVILLKCLSLCITTDILDEETIFWPTVFIGLAFVVIVASRKILL